IKLTSADDNSKLLLYVQTRYMLHLLSIPTRRSSDLSVAAKLACGFARVSLADPQASAGAKPHGAVIPAARASFWLARNAIRSTRSEEHTSELQSQTKLVCRLLPEKTTSTSRTTRPST